jgi:hypothetical protein
MANFIYKGQLNGAENPVTRDFLIKNSQAIVKNTAVILDAANGLIPATAGSKILGIVVGFYMGARPIENVPSSEHGGTWVESTQTFTAGSANVTTQKVVAKVICDKDALFYNDSDDTLTQLMEGLHFNIVNATQIDGSTGVQAAGQMELVKWDSNDASAGTFCICESSRDPYAQA